MNGIWGDFLRKKIISIYNEEQSNIIVIRRKSYYGLLKEISSILYSMPKSFHNLHPVEIIKLIPRSFCKLYRIGIFEEGIIYILSLEWTIAEQCSNSKFEEQGIRVRHFYYNGKPRFPYELIKASRESNLNNIRYQGQSIISEPDNDGNSIDNIVRQQFNSEPGIAISRRETDKEERIKETNNLYRTLFSKPITQAIGRIDRSHKQYDIELYDIDEPPSTLLTKFDQEVILKQYNIEMCDID